MRILSRPMFKYGGPIKEGVMHGMKNGGLSKQFNTGLVGDERYPKTDGREHHGFFIPALYGMGQAALRFGPAAYRGWKASRAFTPWSQNLGKWGRVKDIFLPKKSLRLQAGELGTKYGAGTKAGEGLGFGVGSFARSNPVTTIGLASMVPQGAYLGAKVAKAAPGTVWEGAKRYADMVIPGDQSRWWKDKEPPTGVPLNPNLQKPKTIKQEKKIDKTIAEIAAEAKAARNAKLEKYLDTMGYDRAKKTAIGDALIDASAIVQGDVDEAGSLKKADWGKMINKVIQTTSKRLDKPEQIREAVGLMMTKADIEKDMTSSAHYKTAVDMVNTGAAKDITEAMKLLTNKKLNFEETVGSLSAKKDVTGKVLADAWRISGEGIPTAQISGSHPHYTDFKEKMEEAEQGNIELEYVNVMINDKKPGDIYIIDDRMVEVQPDGTTKYKW